MSGEGGQDKRPVRTWDRRRETAEEFHSPLGPPSCLLVPTACERAPVWGGGCHVWGLICVVGCPGPSVLLRAQPRGVLPGFLARELAPPCAPEEARDDIPPTDPECHRNVVYKSTGLESRHSQSSSWWPVACPFVRIAAGMRHSLGCAPLRFSMVVSVVPHPHSQHQISVK